MIKICEICGKELRPNRKRFCSRDCSNKDPLKIARFKKLGKRNKTGRNNPMYGIHRFGKENPFYGKAHKKETIEIISKKNKKLNRLNPDRLKGKKNPMYGKHPISPRKGKKLEEIFGEEKANRLKRLYSKNASGKNNPMYGKPSPQGAGNGWSGWYKDRYFRSILELSAMVYFESNNILFESAEKNRVPYKFFGKNRTYAPDFYLPKDDTFVECKYSKLVKSPNVEAKTKAAKKHFTNFKILTECDIPKLTDSQIKNLWLKQDLKWNKLYEALFLEKIKT